MDLRKSANYKTMKKKRSILAGAITTGVLTLSTVPGFSQSLDDFTLYWLTNSATSAARIYWENMGKGVPRPGNMGQARLFQPCLFPRS